MQGADEPRTDPTAAGRASPGDDARRAGEEIKREVSDAGHRARDTAEQAAHQVGDRVRHEAESGKQRAADEVGGIASALRSAASDLETNDRAGLARYVNDAAGEVDRFSSAIANRDFGDMVDATASFARRNPALFVGGAMLAGFTMARAAKASAERRAREDVRHSSTRPVRPAGAPVNSPYPADPGPAPSASPSGPVGAGMPGSDLR